MTHLKLNQTITLLDGRVLGYAESGDLDGVPLFLFHGLNSSRLEVNIVHEKMKKRGIRLIGIDRPGMGLSTFQENRTVLDFVEDVIALADALHIDKFSIMGVSAGTAYALACLHKIPERISFCGLVSAMAPILEIDNESMSKENRSFISLSKTFPWFIKPLFWFMQGRLSQDDTKVDQFLNNIMLSLDDVDKQLIEDKKAKKVLLDTFREAYKEGTKGVGYDARVVFTQEWGFSLNEIDFPIQLWHGEKDKGVPLLMVKSMVKKLKNARLKTYKDEGHLSIIFNQMDEIIADFLKEINCYNRYRSEVEYT